MQQRRASVYLALVVTVAILACTGLLLFGGAVLPAAASVLQQVGATPMAAQGTVAAAALNVRAEPALTGRVVGTLRLGSQVNILGQRAGWYQIEDARGPEGKGWVSARFIKLNSGNNTSPGMNAGVSAEAGAEAGAISGAVSGAAAGEGQVSAPVVVVYQPPVLRWRWAGDTVALGDKDWYFDIQVIRKYDAYPYWTQVVEPPGKSQGAQQQGGTYRVDIQAIQFRCDSSMAVQIAVRENGRFAGWISPRSNLLVFTPACQQNSAMVEDAITGVGNEVDSNPEEAAAPPPDAGMNAEPQPPPSEPVNPEPGRGDEDEPNPQPTQTPTQPQPTPTQQPTSTDTPAEDEGPKSPEPTQVPPPTAEPPATKPPPETTAAPAP